MQVRYVDRCCGWGGTGGGAFALGECSLVAAPLFFLVSRCTRYNSARWGHRRLAVFLSLRSVMALLVCGAGVFSLLHYSVSLRRRELGVRAALGAAPGQLLGLVMRRSGALVAAGMVIGIPASVYLGMVLEAELYRVDRSSPMYYLGAAGLLVAIALIASFLPARHAARINPVDCLRAE